MTRLTRRTAAWLLALLAALPLGCTPRTDEAARPDVAGRNPNIRFGAPAPARPDMVSRDGHIIERPQYVLSYSNATKVPNWVSWRLVASDLGKADRGPFEPDPMLPTGFAKITQAAYTNSGFDRGHLCPSADRSDSEANNDPTFYMTNIAPQAPNLNRKGWERLEHHCRELARQGREVHIVCGPSGQCGEGSKGLASHIGGRSAVQVPAHFWKVVLVLPSPGAAPDRRTRALAVVMPNTQQVGTDWSRYQVRPGEVEKLAGYTFFPELPADVARDLRDTNRSEAIEAMPVSRKRTR
jgi:endonuclease G